MKDINGNQIGFDFTQPPRPYTPLLPPLVRGELKRGQGGEFTTEEMHILRLLQRGKENAILGSVIANSTGTDYDRVRAVISHLVNKHNCIIASSSNGYYIPVSESEILDATRSLRHRAICILYRASRLLKSSVVDVFGQSVMEFKDEIK